MVRGRGLALLARPVKRLGKGEPGIGRIRLEGDPRAASLNRTPHVVGWFGRANRRSRRFLFPGEERLEQSIQHDFRFVDASKLGRSRRLYTNSTIATRTLNLPTRPGKPNAARKVIPLKVAFPNDKNVVEARRKKRYSDSLSRTFYVYRIVTTTNASLMICRRQGDICCGGQVSPKLVCYRLIHVTPTATGGGVTEGQSVATVMPQTNPNIPTHVHVELYETECDGNNPKLKRKCPPFR
jgi:hypothetical protein